MDDERVSFSGAEQNLEEIWDNYELLHQSLLQYRDDIRNKLLNGSMDIPEKFVGLSIPELEMYFNKEIQGLQMTLSLNLLAATEARLEIDYLKRAYDRNEDQNSVILRELYDRKKKKASLEDDILGCWKKAQPAHQAEISALKGAFKLRHWLAHGRYWVPKLERRLETYDFFNVYAICDSVQKNLPFIVWE